MLPGLLPLQFCTAGPAQFSLHFTACPVSRSSSDRAPLLVMREPSVTATDGPSHCDTMLIATSSKYTGTVSLVALRFRNPAHFASVSGERGRFIAVAVGHDEKPLTSHGVASFGRAEYSYRN